MLIFFFFLFFSVFYLSVELTTYLPLYLGSALFLSLSIILNEARKASGRSGMR